MGVISTPTRTTPTIQLKETVHIAAHNSSFPLLLPATIRFQNSKSFWELAQENTSDIKNYPGRCLISTRGDPSLFRSSTPTPRPFIIMAIFDIGPIMDRIYHYLFDEDLRNRKFKDNNIHIALTDVQFLDISLIQYPRCLQIKEFPSIGNERILPQGLWDDPVTFTGDPIHGEYRTRNNQYLVRVFHHGRNYGQIEIHGVNENSGYKDFHKGLKDYTWTRSPNILLTYSRNDVILWDISTATKRQLYTSNKAIRQMAVHGDILEILFEDATYRYIGIDGSAIPASIAAMLLQNVTDFDESTGFGWINYADGTHVIERAGSEGGKSGYTIFRPDGIEVGDFEAPIGGTQLLIYLNRFIVVGVEHTVYIYSKNGELLYTKQLPSVPYVIFPELFGHLLLHQ